MTFGNLRAINKSLTTQAELRVDTGFRLIPKVSGFSGGQKQVGSAMLGQGCHPKDLTVHRWSKRQMNKSFSSLIQRFAREDRGASLVEYAVLVGLITVALIGAVTLLSGNISNALNAVANQIAGQTP